MPITRRTPKATAPTPASGRLDSVARIKEYLVKEIDLYTRQEEERLDAASEAYDQKQWVDSATFLAIAAKKQIVRQRMQKLLKKIG